MLDLLEMDLHFFFQRQKSKLFIYGRQIKLIPKNQELVARPTILQATTLHKKGPGLQEDPRVMRALGPLI